MHLFCRVNSATRLDSSGTHLGNMLLVEEICLLNILLDFSPNNLFAIRLCTIVNWAGPKKL